MVNFSCPKCNADDIVKRGKRFNETGPKQLYRCNECRSIFVEPDGFERMRHKPEDITRAVHQYEDGFPLHKVKNHLWQHDGWKQHAEFKERHQRPRGAILLPQNSSITNGEDDV